jgi:uncharacterized membrane protein YcaP (DUF421 family)
MLESLHTLFGEGLQSTQLSYGQVILRAVVVFFAALAVVRIANKRFFAKKTAFDFILGLILASMMARAINGTERLGPTILAGFVLALLHRGLGWLACRWPALGVWVKGTSQTLVENGELNRETMQRHHIGEDDLREELRLQGVQNASEVHLARLERSGEISVIRQKDE